MKTPLPRNLLRFDFICGLSAGAVYFLLFDFMTDVLALPLWLVRTQLIANLLYGAYGAVLYSKRVSKRECFQFLVVMNFAYASFCLAVSLLLVRNGIYAGALLLLVEGLFIAGLAGIERRRIWK